MVHLASRNLQKKPARTFPAGSLCAHLNQNESIEMTVRCGPNLPGSPLALTNKKNVRYVVVQRRAAVYDYYMAKAVRGIPSGKL